MTLSLAQLALYAGAMAALWAVPGPVWVALVARALSGGMRGAWPLAIGVAIGDVFWLLCAAFGLTWILSIYGGFLEALRWVAAAMFITMGIMLWRAKPSLPGSNSRLTRPGIWAGILVGIAAVIGNPKAILFYMGMLPGFFDLSRVSGLDIALIAAISALVPALGNLILAVFVNQARRFLQSEQAIGRVNKASGALLLLVGLIIPFS